jgi:SAM-dependent methyltransferase
MSEPIRALSFGAVAGNYDRYRPSYPAELAADVCALLPGRRVVEVGAGTGIATSRFAARGLDITCVEPDPQMAAVLAGKFHDSDPVRVVVDSFEGWSAGRDPADPPYDGLICAQAWHWTVAGTRWRDAAAALTAGGLVALFWNQDGYADPAVPALLAAAYERYGVTDRAVSSDEDEEPAGWPAEEIAASTGFTDHDSRVYRWNWTQSVADHVARLNTISAHLILPADVRAALTRDLVEALTAHSGGEIALAMRTDLALARRSS